MSVFEALASTGLDVRDYRVPGYKGRGLEVLGTLWHHTAGPRGLDMPSLGACMHGRPDLPGPLCQVLIGRTGVVAVITDGLANHAGPGSWPGVSDGNKHFVGVELENDGKSEPYTWGQLAVAARVGAALRRQFGHALDIGHKEWAPGRKPDPLFDMDAFRRSIDAVNPAPTEEVTVASANRLDVVVRGDDGAVWHRYYTPAGGWTPWASLGGECVGAPAACWFGTQFQVFVRGADDAMWQKFWAPNVGWSEWVNAGGTLTASPAVAVA